MTEGPHPVSAGSEPIAVIGIGCRFAGAADSPEALWKLLAEGRDGIMPVPAERWSNAEWYHPDRDHPGTLNFQQAGFLKEGIDSFDAAYFGIAPREAENMDPQQRLLLEVACEALEDAGIASDSLANHALGIFVGAYNGNFSLMARGAPDPCLIDGWSATGAHASVVAGRLAYFLGTSGPAMVVDTACSSSLVATHLAVRSLRAGECEAALVGGVHLISAPEPLVASSKLGATSPEGRCRVFDAAADGFGHGEGAGVIVLKRLADAEAAGDRVLAVVRGTAINQDGRSNSLTAPNGPAQARVIGLALADAGVDAADIAYVEAHGTATPLGDPIEVEALAEALGSKRQEPLLIGSVKANLGHTEAAAGIAGLIKTILVLENEQVPPQVGFNTLHPEIALLDAPVRVPVALTPLVPRRGRSFAGVSAFGFSGTNAHVVLEASSRPKAVPGSATEMPTTSVIAVSARTASALDVALGRWSNFLRTSAVDLVALAQTSTAGRRHWPHRVAIAAGDRESASRALVTAKRFEVARAPRIAFLCSGQGSQYPGMSRRLYATQPAFRRALDQAALVLDEALGVDTLKVLFGADSIDRTILAQPLLVAVELALAAFWREAGIRAVAVMGHSVGEFTAAALAGAISEADALRLAAVRGRAMQALPAGGGMLAVFAEAAAIEPRLASMRGVLAVAGLNAPTSTVIAGACEDLEKLRVQLEADGIDCRPLAVSHAFHSPMIEPALSALSHAAARIEHKQTHTSLISNVTGQAMANLGADYWIEHARKPVRFAESLQTLVGMKVDVLLELGPDAVLTGLAGLSVPDLTRLPSLRRNRDDDQVIAETLAALHCAGASIDWPALHKESKQAPLRAPLTVFERSRHWLDVPARNARKTFARTSPQLAANRSTTSEQGSPLIYDFYDELTVLSQNYADQGDQQAREEGHLTFGFLEKPDPGFSWVRALFEKDRDPHGHQRLRQTQAALKQALFADLDFTRIDSIFDYGCGHAADLASLVLEHPHLHGRGYTISAGQVDVGSHRLAAMGLADRVSVARNDSSKTAFPVGNDLIFGVEVTGLIADKEGLFANVAAGLTEGGLLVIADFVATHEAIANPDTHSYTPIAREWAELLGRNRLRLVRVVDASAPVANWLDDADFESNVDSVVSRYGLSELTRRHLLSNGNIGRALRADVMRYVLLRAIASPHETVEAVTTANLSAFDNAMALPANSPTPAHEDWFYRVEQKPSPLRPELDPKMLARQIEPVAARESEMLAAFGEVGAAVDKLGLCYLISALRELGANSLDEVRSLSIDPSHRRLLAHLVTELESRGVRQFGETTDPCELDRQTAQDHPEAHAELELLRRCGGRLADVLAGKQDALELIFPAGDTRYAEALYQDSPFSAALQRLAGAACAALPREQPLRAIEIGGGTGATTQQVHAHLPQGSTYLFTDIGSALVARAAERFADLGIETAIYDVERPPSALNIAVGAFDLVVAANVLHATTNLSAALSNAHELLAPGGLLLLIENAGPFLWGDLSYGLTRGMWAFAADGHRQHALIDADAWRNALAVSGFVDIEIIDPGNEGLAGISRQCLILARRDPCRQFGLSGGSEEQRQALESALRAHGHAAVVLDSESALPVSLTDILHLDGLHPTQTAQEILASAHALARQVAADDSTLRLSLVHDQRAASACLDGFARGVSAELPDTRCRSIAVNTQEMNDPSLTLILDAILRGESDCRIRDGQITSMQLLPMAAPAAESPTLRDDCSFLVTGAYGGLGPHLVRWLHRHGARHFVLAGRSLPGVQTRALLEDLEHATLEFAVADISAPGEAERLVGLAQAVAPLGAVFHAAGALADGALSRQHTADMLVPLSAKFDGAQALDRATAGIVLDYFVLFSSAAGLLAPFGQSNHAAAASALDALVDHRKSQAKPVLCIDWGAFAQAGAAMREDIEAKVSASGLGFMPIELAFDKMGHAMTAKLDRLVIIDIDWHRYRKRYPHGGVPYLLETVCLATPVAASKTPARKDEDAVGGRNWKARLAAAVPAHRSDLLCDLVRSEAARILRLPESQLRDQAPLREAGLDSLMSIEFRNVLSEAAATRLGATIVFDYPSVAALAKHLAEIAFAELFKHEGGDCGTDAEINSGELDGLDADALSDLLASELGADSERE